MTKKSANSKLIAIVFLIVGLLAMTALPIYINSVRADETKCTETAEAVIVRYEESIHSSSNNTRTGGHKRSEKLYTPVYEFTAENSTFTGKGIGRSSKPYEIGATVQIHYEPDYPENNYLVPTSPVMIFVAVGFGAVFALIGILDLVLAHKNKNMIQ